VFELAERADDEGSKGEATEGGVSQGQGSEEEQLITILHLIDGRMRSCGLELRIAFIFSMLAEVSQNEEQVERQEDGEGTVVGRYSCNSAADDEGCLLGEHIDAGTYQVRVFFVFSFLPSISRAFSSHFSLLSLIWARTKERDLARRLITATRSVIMFLFTLRTERLQNILLNE
jgi:hypothetical protein